MMKRTRANKMLIYIFLPLILFPAVFIKNKNLSCLWCGVLLFLVSSLSYNPEINEAFSLVSTMPFYSLNSLEYPSGFTYFTKFFSMFISDFRLFYILLCGINTFGTMLYIKKYCYYPAPSSIVLILTGYWFVAISDPVLYMGIMFGLFAFRYASEKRFVRFAVLILLGTCFMPYLILIVPFYLILMTKTRIIHIILAAALCVLLIYTDVTALFGFIGINDVSGLPYYEYLPWLSLSVCILSLITKKIISRRGLYNETMITAALLSAVLSAGIFTDKRFFIFGFICFFPAGLTLIPEIISVVKAVISLTFKDKKRPFLIVSGVILAALAVLLYGNILLTNPYGGIPFETWVGMEAIQ